MHRENVGILVLLATLSLSLQFDLRRDDEQTTSFTNFLAKYPESKIPSHSNITLRGDNCNLTWSRGVAMKKVDTDTWSVALLCPTGVRISCKALINDSDWMMGANHIFIVSDGSSTNTTIYPSFSPKINAVVDTSPISSQYLTYARKLSIYFPPSYYDNPYKKYELLLMHDGQNLFDPAKSAFGAWYCQNTTNLMIGEGKMREIVIVGIWNTPERNS